MITIIIMMTCCAQHLGRYLEGQGHSMTFAAKFSPAHNFVIRSPILKLLHRNDHHIETPCRKQHLGRYLEAQGHSMTLQQNLVRPINLFFEVPFQNYCKEMITMFRRRVASNIWVATLKVNVTA